MAELQKVQEVALETVSTEGRAFDRSAYARKAVREIRDYAGIQEHYRIWSRVAGFIIRSLVQDPRGYEHTHDLRGPSEQDMLIGPSHGRILSEDVDDLVQDTFKEWLENEDVHILACAMERVRPLNRFASTARYIAREYVRKQRRRNRIGQEYDTQFRAGTEYTTYTDTETLLDLETVIPRDYRPIWAVIEGILEDATDIDIATSLNTHRNTIRNRRRQIRRLIVQFSEKTRTITIQAGRTPKPCRVVTTPTPKGYTGIREAKKPRKKITYDLSLIDPDIYTWLDNIGTPVEWLDRGPDTVDPNRRLEG